MYYVYYTIIFYKKSGVSPQCDIIDSAILLYTVKTFM